MKGLIHIYTGDGKGKTTAAIGLAIRMAGNDKNVCFTQFFKHGASSEINILSHIPQIKLNICTTHYGLYKNMSDESKKKAKKDYTSLLQKSLDISKNVNLLVLDEVISAYNRSMVPKDLLLDLLKHKPDDLEIVLTGRNPSEKLIALADYVTEMQKIKHPFDSGTRARKGIEY